jgi:hypothetical protein
MRVECYRNLHTGKISVREAGGKVLTHEDNVFIRNPRFVVQPAGRQRVLAEQRKNVHAFVRGELLGFSAGQLVGFTDWPGWTQATYNPYRTDTFYDRDTGVAVLDAAKAVVTTNGVFYA